MYRSIWGILFCFLLPAASLFAEITAVLIQFQKLVQYPDTYVILEKQLKSIPAALDVKLNPESSIATFRWEPNTSFSFSPINLASRASGATIETLTISVRGTVEKTGLLYQLRSIGDNTTFKLLGPFTSAPGQPPVRGSIQGRKLTPVQKQQLELSEKERLIITVTGELISPQRYLEFYLDIQKITLPEEDKKQEDSSPSLQTP